MPIIREWVWAACPSRRRLLRLLLRGKTIEGKTVVVPPAVGGTATVADALVDRVARDAAIVRGREAAVHDLGGNIGIVRDRAVQLVAVADRGGDITVVVGTGGVDRTVDPGGISPLLVERGRVVDIMIEVLLLKIIQIKAEWG